MIGITSWDIFFSSLLFFARYQGQKGFTTNRLLLILILVQSSHSFSGTFWQRQQISRVGSFFFIFLLRPDRFGKKASLFRVYKRLYYPAIWGLFHKPLQGSLIDITGRTGIINQLL